MTFCSVAVKDLLSEINLIITKWHHKIKPPFCRTSFRGAWRLLIHQLDPTKERGWACRVQMYFTVRVRAKRTKKKPQDAARSSLAAMIKMLICFKHAACACIMYYLMSPQIAALPGRYTHLRDVPPHLPETLQVQFYQTWWKCFFLYLFICWSFVTFLQWCVTHFILLEKITKIPATLNYMFNVNIGSDVLNVKFMSWYIV